MPRTRVTAAPKEAGAIQTLLLLEEEPKLSGFLRRALRGYLLVHATTAEEALLAFSNHAHHIDLLIAKVALLKSSGIHVASLLRFAVGDLPIILMSAHPVSDWSDRDVSDLARLGTEAVEVLQKPFDADVILGVVQRLLAARRPKRHRSHSIVGARARGQVQGA